ncbi:MAG: two-component sensor histidine kinase [Flavobacteriales bacterium CG_4_8_14_3_um_filter_35_10]|nr:sensor histidine kinase [Zetaproteobacteria bacterium]OIO12784.1 MAG: two-component sensor histidine kinase [Flavobacteriaceae bacterium CG1_02_35_72]PIR12641.1 MAG: two-component sensor histidine kinase [Flavobacteriales bacterium CG11_big_fil_rev_8_21_14_0_20_35_7]PIX08067.1 MAG: two-component sensor histidine kinase [Flavobacteriales bacterium CG_4_8_14_3_um_filter_35_10]PJA05680.1 MAG: two-component sensor histidine kinase [Flavobacteriales bacterium CG_4_10_14_0_2_um_filter_35_18]
MSVIKSTYKFAIILALILSLTVALLQFILNSYFSIDESVWQFLIFFVVFLLISLVIIQNRVQQFIYKKVQKIYDDVSLLDVSDLAKKPISSDMDALSKKVNEFAEGKRLEIETLQMRETYRREFLGNISHELKTPLFTIQGYILTLLEGAVKNKELRTKYLKRADKGVERLIYIIKDLDMITKLETGNLSLKMDPIDLVSLIKNSFELLEIKAKKHKVSLTFDKNYDTPILVKADKERLEQVLLNLIINSLKYGKNGGLTTVSIADFSKNQVVVNVKDNGEGISKEHLPRLFERFYRVEQSRSRKEGGSGLGLAIVKHIIESHKQQVFVKSTIGKGSTFSFTLEKVL